MARQPNMEAVKAALTTLIAEGVFTLSQAQAVVLDAVGLSVTPPPSQETVVRRHLTEQRAKRKVGTRNGILGPKNAKSVSKSLGMHSRGATNGVGVTVERSVLAKSAAKIGITAQQYIDWGVNHGRIVRREAHRYLLLTTTEAIARLDVTGTMPAKTIATKLGMHPSAVTKSAGYIRRRTRRSGQLELRR